MCCSAVNDGSCSPWVMCSCSVVRGNQIRDNMTLVKTKQMTFILGCLLPLQLVGLRFRLL